MKSLYIIILILLATNSNSFSQNFLDLESLNTDTTYTHLLPFYKNFHLHQLGDTSQFRTEKVTYGKKILRLVISPKSDKNEMVAKIRTQKY